MSTTERVGATDPPPAATLERRGPVALITLNRPHALNAVNAAMSRAAGDALAEFGADPDLRVAVLTGAGRAFCAGADLKELAAGRSVLDDDHPGRGFAGIVRQFVDKPVVAAVNGFALGGGRRSCWRPIWWCWPRTRSSACRRVTRGLVAAAGGLLRLHRQIPSKAAAEAVYTGDPIEPAAALVWGLVNRVVPAADVLSTALDLVEGLLADLDAERAQLCGLAEAAPLGEWARPSGALRWSVRDQPARLAFFDGVAALSVGDPEAFAREGPRPWPTRTPTDVSTSGGCLLGRRRHVDDTALVATGASAREWLAIGQAYAGAPRAGPTRS